MASTYTLKQRIALAIVPRLAALAISCRRKRERRVRAHAGGSTVRVQRAVQVLKLPVLLGMNEVLIDLRAGEAGYGLAIRRHPLASLRNGG